MNNQAFSDQHTPPRESKNELMQNQTTTKRKKVRILSIDGGGIRGILPATILHYLENQLQVKTGDDEVRLSDYFDYMAGTSTGGILAATYLLENPKKPGRPRYTAEETLDMYLEKRGCGIFSRSLSRKITSLMGLLNEKYSAKRLEQSLKNCLGKHTEFRDLLKPCLITAYDIQKRKPRFFRSEEPTTDQQTSLKLWQVAKATASAPSYFEPSILTTKNGEEEVLIDGGVFANNPAFCAYTNVQQLCFSQLPGNQDKPDHPRQEDMLIVSLGTGNTQKSYPFQQVKSKGLLTWLRPLVDILVNAGNETVDHQLNQLFESARGEHRGSYYRLNPNLKKGEEQMDNIHPNNLQALYQRALAYIRNNREKLDALVDELIANH